MVSFILIWLFIGFILTAFLLAMEEQREGASITYLFGSIVGPLMLFFIVLRYIDIYGGRS